MFSRTIKTVNSTPYSVLCFILEFEMEWNVLTIFQ